ncbi:16S rRNA (guanine(527)-N(7))-methyltransferase RsmG [Pandoraea terrae]|uniref:16S rRNA (guanine(527)-N(7))-methyltransferase RsmG n=1 Tax=Pandoraea terrae TaxID=1537710 RepID=UPI00123F6262|nr:16S rRNA (guanine(527)-N(7))-methyltransferase RsmG [Pandoraea terrae]
MTSRSESSKDKDLAAMLAEGVAQLGVALDEDQHTRLLDYLALLAKWNGVYNLTAIRDPRQMLIQHVLDSLAIVPHLVDEPITRILDVGSGGGLPGMILAVTRPDWQITVNDIVHKKTAFLTQAKGALKLDNVTVITGRVEQLQIGAEVSAPFDAIVSRAFADLSDFVGLARHLLTSTGSIWAMKGVAPDEEIARLPADCQLLARIRLQVPFLDAERHLLRVKVGV